MKAYLKTIYQYVIKPVLIIILGLLAISACYLLLYLFLKYLSKVNGLMFVQIIGCTLMALLLIVALVDAYLMLKPHGSFKKLLNKNKKDTDKHMDGEE